MINLFAPNFSTTLVMGVGTLGGEVAAAGAVEDDAVDGFPVACWSAAHADAARLIATGLERKLFVDSGPAGGGPFAEQCLLRSLNEKDDELRMLLAGRDAVILTGSLQEQTAALLLPILTAEFSNRGMFVCAVTLEASSDKTRRVAFDADLRVPVIDDGSSGEISVGSGRRRSQKRLLATTLTLCHVMAERAEIGVPAENLIKSYAQQLALPAS